MAVTIEEAMEKLTAARAKANAAKTPTEKIDALTEVHTWTMAIRKNELQVVAHATHKAKIEDKKTRGARSHFLFVVAGELFKRAKTNASIRSAIASLVAGISDPKEKKKAQSFLATYQAEWATSPLPTKK